MRDNYDRLVMELGVNPRSTRGAAHTGGESLQLPRVPQSRHWEAGKCKTSPTRGSQSARSHPVGFGLKAKATSFDSGAARLVLRLDVMTESGQVTAAQANRLRKLWTLQDSLLSGVTRLPPRIYACTHARAHHA